MSSSWRLRELWLRVTAPHPPCMDGLEDPYLAEDRPPEVKGQSIPKKCPPGDQAPPGISYLGAATYHSILRILYSRNNHLQFTMQFHINGPMFFLRAEATSQVLESIRLGSQQAFLRPVTLAKLFHHLPWRASALSWQGCD